MSVEIITAKTAGFCFGVRRAVTMLEKELDNGTKVYSLGEIIHNRDFVDSLTARGVVTLDAEDVDGVPEDATVFIRTHGAKREIYKRIEERNLKYIDMVCPYVKKIHNIIEKETENGKLAVIIGDANHPEVQGIYSYAKGNAAVFPNFDSLYEYCENTDLSNSFVAVVQTTFKKSEWERCSRYLRERFPEAAVYDTICAATEERQRETRELAEECDVVVIVGGRKSSNTAKLYETAEAVACKTGNKKVIFAENSADIKALGKESFAGAKKIAITAGASTPSVIIQEVLSQMEEFNKEELSFEELLDRNFKVINTGERVTGVISAVSPAEIHVDFGTKHTGILPSDEITLEAGVSLESVYHVGDSIEVIPVKFNDAEGTVLLSKKRIDAAKDWTDVVAAYENKTTITGVVKEVIKGGVVVYYKTLRIFVPASRTGLSRDADLSILKNREVAISIIEVTEGRKRAVGSIRTNTSRIERQKEVEEFLANLQVGAKFKGTIKSITSYGVFVNIGPIEGMVYISELFWGRIKSIASEFKVDDEIDVYVKSFEMKDGKPRISLGYKTEENNPWRIFFDKYAVGDVVDVKIVTLMAYGAFAEILPGVDGLIHISQVSNKQVQNLANVLTVGQTVQAKIIAVAKDEENLSKSKISLSIRALLSEAEAEEAAADEGEANEEPNE